MLARQRGLGVGLSLALVGLVCLVVIVAGCGGGASSSSPATTSPSSPHTGAGSNSEPSAQFSKKAANGIATFGEEASAEEREAVNAVVVESLKAREEGDFTTQCATLSLAAIKTIPGAENHAGCPTALKKFAEPLSKSKPFRKDTLSGSIAALRVEGGRGFALYHGNDGKDYSVPVEKEDGAWKVGSFNTTEI